MCFNSAKLLISEKSCPLFTLCPARLNLLEVKILLFLRLSNKLNSVFFNDFWTGLSNICSIYAFYIINFVFSVSSILYVVFIIFEKFLSVLYAVFIFVFLKSLAMFMLVNVVQLLVLFFYLIICVAGVEATLISRTVHK